MEKIDRPQSFGEAVIELLRLVNETGTPRNAFDSAFKLLNVSGKCVVVKLQFAPAPPTDDMDIVLQPSDLFARFMAAFRARNWPLVDVIEHEATS